MFIVIDTVNEQEYEPSYSFSGTGRYVTASRTHIHEIFNIDELTEFLSREKAARYLFAESFEQKN